MSDDDAPRDDPYAAIAWMSAAAFSFAGMNALARGLRHLPWPMLGFSRALFGLGASLVVARLRGATLAVRDQRIMWQRSLFGSTGMLCTFYALTHMPLADATALLNTTPLWIAALAFVTLGERVSPRVLLALAVAVVGVCLVERPTGSGAYLPGLVALGAGAAGAMAMVSLRRLSGESPEGVVVHFSAVACGVQGVAWALTREAPTMSLRDGGRLVLMGVLATAGQLSLTRAYALDKAARVGAAGWLQVLIALGLDAVCFGHLPDRYASLGIGALLVAGVLLVWDARQSVRQSVAPR